MRVALALIPETGSSVSQTDSGALSPRRRQLEAGPIMTSPRRVSTAPKPEASVPPQSHTAQPDNSDSKEKAAHEDEREKCTIC